MGSFSNNREQSEKLNQLLNEEENIESVLEEISEQMNGVDSKIEASFEDMCVECEDQPHSVLCETCKESFCLPCFQQIHQKGTRKKHQYKDSQRSKSNADSKTETKVGIALDEQDDYNVLKLPEETRKEQYGATFELFDNFSIETFVERAKYIPLRPTLKERKLLRLVEATMDISEYTDKVDIVSFRSKKKRIFAQIKDICSILTGLVVATDYKEGKTLLEKSNFGRSENFFQDAFEVARRHKIRNPEKSRNSYGKLIHFLQDSIFPQINNLLGFSCVREIKSVYSFLGERSSLDCLKDITLLLKATDRIKSEGLSRRQIDRALEEKEKNRNNFISKHSKNGQISSEDLEIAILSIGDNHSFLEANRLPVDKVLRHLIDNFDPEEMEKRFSLAIRYGVEGTRLTHDHRKQYCFVKQTLLLWREILNNFFKLWHFAEKDMLSGNPYELTDTGQGLQRIQRCNNVGREMRQILAKVKNKVSSWVGSSVIHLGDHNVPNSFIFIDKYSQISRILNPVVLTIERINEISDNKPLSRYIKKQFGSAENLKMDILTDFFRHAFDGSGADNFYDAGSCIDGRLTSLWNWGQNIAKKPFYPIFLLTGFSSFDGDWS